MAIDFERLAEELGRRVSEDFAESIDTIASELRAYADEGSELAQKLRNIGPYVVNKRCAICGEIMRGPDHKCSEDIFDTTARESDGGTRDGQAGEETQTKET